SDPRLYAIGNLHLEHPVEVPTDLVQDVGDAVAALWDYQGVVAKGCFADDARMTAPLVGRQQLVDRDAGVDYVLAVVSGIVPATGEIEGVVLGPVPASRTLMRVPAQLGVAVRVERALARQAGHGQIALVGVGADELRHVPG